MEGVQGKDFKAEMHEQGEGSPDADYCQEAKEGRVQNTAGKDMVPIIG